MTWYPNCVLIGPRISPGAIEKTACSNSGTICPFEKGGSAPPLPLPEGSSVFSLASFAKSSPFFARSATFSAFVFAAASPSAPLPSSGLIRMWAATTCSGTAKVALRLSYSARSCASGGMAFWRTFALSTRRYLILRCSGAR